MYTGYYIDQTSNTINQFIINVRNYDEARKAYLNALKYDKDN